MGWEAFETATRQGNASQGSTTGTLTRYRPQIAVSALVVIVLIGGALYASRVSEHAPQVVYSASLEEVEDEARDSLQVNTFYEFSPYNYGPFCREVYVDAEALAKQGFISITPVAPYGYSEYSATPEGAARASRMADTLPDEVTVRAREIVDRVRQQSFRGLVSAMYEQYPAYKVNSVFTG